MCAKLHHDLGNQSVNELTLARLYSLRFWLSGRLALQGPPVYELLSSPGRVGNLYRPYVALTPGFNEAH